MAAPRLGASLGSAPLAIDLRKAITVNVTDASTLGECPFQTAVDREVSHEREVMASIGRLLRIASVIQRRERRRGRRVQPRFHLSQIGVTSLGGLMAVCPPTMKLAGRRQARWPVG